MLHVEGPIGELHLGESGSQRRVGDLRAGGFGLRLLDEVLLLEALAGPVALPAPVGQLDDLVLGFPAALLGLPEGVALRALLMPGSLPQPRTEQIGSASCRGRAFTYG